MDIETARRSEQRRHEGLADAVLAHLVCSDADRAYYEAALETLWHYGEHSPLDAAAEALASGDRERMERALGVEKRLTALAAGAR